MVEPYNELMTEKLYNFFESKDEYVLYSAFVTKITPFEKESRVKFCLTGDNFYLFTLRDRQFGSYAIRNLEAIVKSSKSTEIVFIYPTYKDLRIKGQ